MDSNNQHQEDHLPGDVLTSNQSSVIGGDVPPRKRGRPPIALTEEVLERRRMSRLRVNASRPRVEDGNVPSRKRGRPPIALTDEVLERRRLSIQRVNASGTETKKQVTGGIQYHASVVAVKKRICELKARNGKGIQKNVLQKLFCSMETYRRRRLRSPPSECNKNVKKRPSTDFMEKVQKDINTSMPAILVDWLVEVAEEYRLVPDTLYLTVKYYVDRYLSGNSMDREKLQFLGVACMMIASKYEEISAPQVEEFCYITDNTYFKDEVLEMEYTVLNFLKFELTAPTAKCFLRRFVRAAQAVTEAPAMQLECTTNYLAELTLLEYHMLHYAPSLIAASAIFLARYMLFPSRRHWVKKRPSTDFMEKVQKDINTSMRAILVDWLVEVAEEYRLVPDTLYLTVKYYVDRYLSGNSMDREKLQFLGVACMMIASKYEEISAPQVEEFCYITDNTYFKDEVLEVEYTVLNFMKFELTAPTAKCFLRRFVRAAQAVTELECTTNYLAELTLLEYHMLHYAPSLIAASAISLARYMLFPSRRPWVKKRPSADFMEKVQKDINTSMRAILVDWLVEVGGFHSWSLISEYRAAVRSQCSHSQPSPNGEDDNCTMRELLYIRSL